MNKKIKGGRIKIVTEDDVVHGMEFTTFAELLDWLKKELDMDCAPRRGKAKAWQEEVAETP